LEEGSVMYTTIGLLAVDLVAAHKPGIPLNRIWKPVEVRRILSTLASKR